MRIETAPSALIDVGALPFASGSHLLLKRALGKLPAGGQLGVRSTSRDFAVHLRAWCRSQGHGYIEGDAEIQGWIVRGTSPEARWQWAERSSAIVDAPPPSWGFAARGATVEAGDAGFHYPLSTRAQVWSRNIPNLHAQSWKSQWDPNTAIDWEMPLATDPEIERALVQVMTYLIENENAALQVPARFIAQVHPHFREVLQLLALQIADEARHVEVFTRRATLCGDELGLSTLGGRESLRTLLAEPDYALASFLLSVMGEGTFLNLLRFIEQHAPDPITAQVAHLAGQDEARHVAFGLGHLQYQLDADPSLRERLATAVMRRHDVLAATTGLNEEVFDSLVLLAAGSWKPEDIAAGYARVQMLTQDMHSGRCARLERLGFSAAEAAELSALHTRNFM